MHMNTPGQARSTLRNCPICGHNDVENWVQAPDRYHGKRQAYQLVRCASCSMVWLDNPPKPEELGQHYGADYDKAIGTAGETSPGRWRHRWEALSKYRTSGSLLDLGCSSGSFLASLDRRSWKLHGIEMSSVAAKKAETISGAQVFVGDVLSAPFPPKSFDVITCFDVLEHLYEPAKVLAKVQEWLKPGGIFYVLVPNIESIEALFFKSYWYGLELPRHLSHFSPRSLRKLAESVGLQVVSLATHRNSSLIYNLRYISNDMLRRIGVPRVPLAKAAPPSIPWRIVYKGLRMGGSVLLSPLSSLPGKGESIHAVFTRSENRRAATPNGDRS